MTGLVVVAAGYGEAQKSADMQTVVTGNTAFALKLYDQLRTERGNLFFSPYSISTALAMTSAGARGETQKQMEKTLHFDLRPDQLHPAFAGLAAYLAAVQQAGQVQLAEANSLWPQAGYTFLPEYFDLCQKNYGVAITPVDYREHTEAARQSINDWVEARTNRKIVELLKPGTLDASTRLTLVNAIYFKGNWGLPFETNSTVDEPFYVSLDKTTPISLMQQQAVFRYAKFSNLAVLELPYVGGDLSLLVLLPGEVDGLGHLEAKLTPHNLADWTTDLRRQKVQVYLPRFKLTTEFSLAQTLAAMGMTDAFDADRADFSGMDGRKDLYISKVVHQAFIEVNEQGTEAAAATAVIMEFGGEAPRAVPVPIFRADHPFLFVIRDNRNGSVLFLGRVTNPAL